MLRWSIAFVLALGVTASAHAEGLHFDGDLLLEDHTFLRLTKAQRRAIEAAPWDEIDGHPYRTVTLRLTTRQRRALRRATGVTIYEVGAQDRAVFEHDCTCGSYNVAVIYPDGRIAVVHGLLNEHPPSLE